MFDSSRKKQQQARATKPIQSLEDLEQELGMDELVKHTLLVEVRNALQKTFGDWAQKVNTKLRGEKVFEYEAIHIIQEMSCTWSNLHNVINAFCEK